jgi:hypothetical protein
MYLNSQGVSDEISIFCGAPLQKLKSKEQKVDIFWKGKLNRTVIFKENKMITFFITDAPFECGFLELRVNPTFNLKNMQISNEARDLGVQIFAPI